MIVTPHFVFINNPRTGTTFARKAIAAAYYPGGNASSEAGIVREQWLPVRRGARHAGRDQHATYAQILRCFATLPVVSVVRNPFTLLVAVYELGLWRPRQVPRDPTGELRRHHPDSFEYFLRVQELAMRARWGLGTDCAGVGPLSAHHLQMFARRPRAAFEAVRASAASSEIDAHIGDITFLRQEHLAEDLCQLLRGMGASVDFEAIRAHPPSHVTPRSREWSRASFSKDMISRILHREAFLFLSLSRRGINYSFENAEFLQRQKPPVDSPSATGLNSGVGGS